MNKEGMNKEDVTKNQAEFDADEWAMGESSGREEVRPGNGSPDGEDVSDEQLLLDQQNRIEELERRLEELKEQNLRRAAELDNIKKRVQRERAMLFEQARAESVEHFLPVNDDLKRTLQAISELKDEKLKGVLKGVQLVSEKFDEVLKRYGVERIDETGVPFDVDLHDALMRKKVGDEEVDSNTVLEVLESGYRIGDRTIRFAKVIVSE